MSLTVTEKRVKFRALHQQGCFILPNPGDAGSARILQSLGFSALDARDRHRNCGCFNRGPEDRQSFRALRPAESVNRIRAARSAIDQTGEDVILVARTEGLLIDSTGIKKAIDKLVAFADAGADCLYAPGVGKKEHISAMVRAVAPKAVNVLVMGAGPTAAELEGLGVRRISVGGALALSAWGAMVTSSEMLRAGKFDSLGGQTSGGRLNEIFSTFE